MTTATTTLLPPAAPVLTPESVGVAVRTARPLRCPRCTGTVLIERIGSEQGRELMVAECWRCDALPVHISIGQRGDVRRWSQQDPARKAINPNQLGN